MNKSTQFFTLFAGLSGLFSVIMGAAAAHKSYDLYAADLLRQASLYQLAHSVAMLALSKRSEWPARVACLFFGLGIVLFCGGLGIKALMGSAFFTAFIPFGGGCLMLGWISVAAMAVIKNPAQGA